MPIWPRSVRLPHRSGRRRAVTPGVVARLRHVQHPAHPLQGMPLASAITRIASNRPSGEATSPSTSVVDGQLGLQFRDALAGPRRARPARE